VTNPPVVALAGVTAASLATWLYLALGRGRFWRTSIGLPAADIAPASWPSVVAVVPARDEAEMLPKTLPTLLAQEYPGRWQVVLVDDDSTDATAAIAATLGVRVVRGDGPPPGWAGKVAAMQQGVVAAGAADYLLFTDADIAFPPDALRGLVTAAQAHHLLLTSQMVRLRSGSRWERLVVPAFVYFFAQLYPFALVNGPGRTAAAAGGCMLVRRDALLVTGGLTRIRGALIDDVALARLLKGHGRVWLGLAAQIRSIREYPRLADLWMMVARSAYTQLRYSPLLLTGTVLGLLVIYVMPPTALIAGLAGGAPLLALVGGLTWAVMALTYVPMLRFYEVQPFAAVLLPATAVLYLAVTIDSARRHFVGRGGAWKGRVEQRA
jgi:hopene-associated glycosyltransferase HpnB